MFRLLNRQKKRPLIKLKEKKKYEPCPGPVQTDHAFFMKIETRAISFCYGWIFLVASTLFWFRVVGNQMMYSQTV